MKDEKLLVLILKALNNFTLFHWLINDFVLKGLVITILIWIDNKWTSLNELHEITCYSLLCVWIFKAI